VSEVVLGTPYETAVSPLRRQPGRRRRRQGLPRLFAGALLRALLLVGAPGSLLLWLLYSPYFLIRELQVQGGTRVSAAWVEENLRPLAGRHILAVSLEGVRRRLSDHPWIASVALRRELPDRLRVVVVERQPVARLVTDGGMVFLDVEGEPIAPCPAGAGEGLLLVRHGWPGTVPVREVLEVVGELQRVEPAWGLGVREAEVLGERELRVRGEALPFALLLRGGEVAAGVRNLRRVLPELETRFATIESVDLRQPHRLVVRPAVGEEGDGATAIGRRAPAAAGGPRLGARRLPASGAGDYHSERPA
jgi:cell division septal protein FtsQ